MKFMLVQGHRMTGDVPVSLREGRMYLGEQLVDTAPIHPDRTFIHNEFEALKNSLEWQGPTLIVFTGPAPGA